MLAILVVPILSGRRILTVLAFTVAHFVTPPGSPAQNLPGFSATVTYGGTGGNTARRIEDALIESGYDDTPAGSCDVYGDCATPDGLPASTVDHQAFSLGLRYRFSTRYSAEIQGISLGSVMTQGYRFASDGGAYTKVRRQGWLAIATVARHSERGWLGVGPALLTTDWKLDTERRRVRQVGLALDAGLVLLKTSRFTPVARAQYWASAGAPLDSRDSGARIPISGSEFHVGVGFGLRLSP